GIFVTDFTGDGAGDGSLVSNGTGLGDVLPGTNVGSFGTTVTASKLNTTIANYNNTYADHPTPAGTALVNANLVTSAQLTRLGAVLPLVSPAPIGAMTMPWLKSLDVNLSWVHRVKDKVDIEPGVSFFNVANFANFGSPDNLLSGVLSGAPYAVNGTSGRQPDN